jgi:hydrogenase expression/formation protein HypE
MSPEPDFAAACPLPLRDYSQVMMAHGGGGTLMQRLLDRVFLPAFQNPALAAAHDGAALQAGGERLAFTTDAFVVNPLFFPGGDIGRLAVFGTVNDLAMCGAQPRWLSAAFILEEGLSMDTLERVVRSMQEAAREAGVQLVAGDTKVVDRGRGDGIFLATSGVGSIPPGVQIAPAEVRPGDAVVVSGDLGRHGMAIMSVREGLAFESPIESDCAPLLQPVQALLEAGVNLHCLRDLTRGGLASAVNEVAHTAGLQMDLEEAAIPVSDPVRAACEILGFDPLHVANEGRFAAWVASDDAERAVAVLRSAGGCPAAARIGGVREGTAGLVTLGNAMGSRRILDRLSGEQLPRIC